MMGSCMFSILLYTHSDHSSPCFRPSAVLYKPNWEGELRRVLNSKVVAHELSHFWFGNLVTPRWWDALWLSEGAATFFASLILNKVGTVQFSVPLIKFRLWKRLALNSVKQKNVAYPSGLELEKRCIARVSL